MRCLSAYCNTPAIQTLENLYGLKLEQMPKRDLLAFLIALSECTYVANDGTDSESLGVVATEINGHNFENPLMPSLLDALDEELDLDRADYLIAGLGDCLCMNRN